MDSRVAVRHTLRDLYLKSECSVIIWNSTVASWGNAAEEARENADMGTSIGDFRDDWAVAVDNGYQIATENIRDINPKKVPTRGLLTTDEKRSNKNIARDRIV